MKTKIYGSDMRRYNVRTVAPYSLMIVSWVLRSKERCDRESRRDVLEKKGTTSASVGSKAEKDMRTRRAE